MNIVTRNSAIDLLRIIFALLILGYHGRGLLSGSDYNGAFYGGYIGVEFFFLVSGFLMAASAIKKEQIIKSNGSSPPPLEQKHFIISGVNSRSLFLM